MRFAFLLLFLPLSLLAQNKKPGSLQHPITAFSFEQQFQGMKYRCIGPFRGGRSTAVTGIASKPFTFFMGSTGGGVWRTDDGGTTWKNITDNYLPVGSIGSIRVSSSDVNVMYVGTGSADPRGNVSTGKGIYKSTDGGKTWAFSGIEKGGQIGTIEIHPQNPDIVFAAVLGNPFGPNPERGIYRTKDGGKNWEKVLFVNNMTGASEIVMDPNNPRILYAGMWSVQRKPWTMIDGSSDGGVWMSNDMGDTWKKMEGGLPTGILGKISIAISPQNSDRIWVLLETPDNEKGGLYRSDDGGKTFNRVNGSRELRMRAWYYTHVYADPTDAETVYVNNVRFLKSTNGGNSFDPIRVLHGDCHDLWINPLNPQIFIHANDGGAHVTYNGGQTWSTLFNQPTSELYRVQVDNQFPYRVYGCQQDNTSISVPSATRGAPSPLQDWRQHEGGESGYVAIDPRDPNLTFSGNYTGIIDRYNQAIGHSRTVTHYPQMHDGLPLHQVKYRFQWNAPLFISPHNPDQVYHASQFVHQSMDGGLTWKLISPDLTTNKKEYQEIPGGPVQHDYTGVENFTTIFALEESILEPGTLWAGSDDGLVHVTQDGGLTWKNVTPPGLPPLATVNAIDISKHKKGKVYVTAHNYRLNDFKPYIFRSEDYGKTWSLIINGIANEHFVRVVREDPNREGLLYCGTEFGLYISMDDGKRWQSFQLNLPRTPITDLVVKNKDLVLSTQGRSFWILDDLSPLYQWKSTDENEKAVLFKPRESYRTQLGGYSGQQVPENAPKGTVIYFYHKDKPDTGMVYRLEIINDKDQVKKVFSTKPIKVLKQEKFEVKQGLNRFIWDMTFSEPNITAGSIFSMAYTGGPSAPPGQYAVKMVFGDKHLMKTFTVAKDPRWTWPDEDLVEQYNLTMKVYNALSEIHEGIRKIRNVRQQSNAIVQRAAKIGKADELIKMASSMNQKLSILEEILIQTRHQSYQDPINYPPKLDDQIAWLYGIVNAQDAKPTQGCYDLYRDLREQLDGHMKQLDAILAKEVKEFNDLVMKEQVGGIVILAD